jgi:hypothetical protein
VIYFLKHLIHIVVIDTKRVDTRFYMGKISRIFDLAKFAFYVLRKYNFFSFFHYSYLLLVTIESLKFDLCVFIFILFILLET